MSFEADIMRIALSMLVLGVVCAFFIFLLRGDDDDQ